MCHQPGTGQGLAESGAFTASAGQAVVDVDPLGLDAEPEQGVALGGQVLLIGGASGVPDKQRAHGAPPKLGPAVPQVAVSSGIGQCPTLSARTFNDAPASAAARHKRIVEWDVSPLGCPYLQEGF